jgi:2'-5' RNA ligase
MRAFIALEFDDRLKDIVTATQQTLRETEGKISWIDPQQAHLTLKFFADINETQVEEIEKIMDVIFKDTPSTNFTLDKLGTFPNEHSPRVVWLGIQDHKNILRNLSTRLEKSLEPLLPHFRDKPFEPHITIGRIKLLNDPSLWKDRMKNIPIEKQEITLKEISFIKSVLSSSGPSYSYLKRCPCS